MAQFFLKSGAGLALLNPYLIGGVMVYGLSTFIYIIVLGKFNLSVAYPVVIGLTMIATSIVGVWLLREKVTEVYWVGIGLILSGVFAVAFGKSL